MTRKSQQTKRKREESPEDTSKTRQKRTKGGKSSGQLSLSTFATVNPSKAWMNDLESVNDITQVHAQAACGFGPLGHKQCCPNKFARTALEPIKEGAKTKAEVIDISDSEEDVQHVCSQVKCKANPYCLNYLGQDKWESPGEGIKVIKTATQNNFGGNPGQLLRDPKIPVGLKNLGATCYANAFIQVWNRQDAFRSAVFQCIPPISETETLENSPIFQLQVTFAALSYGSAACFDPTPLIESLKLNRGEQQDAQEFSKLFLSHLAEQFAKQSAPNLKNIVASQFEGVSVYGTLCHGCGYKSAQETRFSEIEIGIMNNSTLEDCLQDSLQSEVLSGDNRYQCPQCQSLQDATRYSEIRELPPVLHFSVQRFVFDFNTLSRKKSKNLIKYPLVIDMARWKQKNTQIASDSLASDEIYDLCGVLIHKGSSAYSGHYESQVLDPRTKTWYQYNDETVTELPRMGDSSMDLSSKDCYCLIYARRDSSKGLDTLCEPSEEVSSRVRAQDEVLLNQNNAFTNEMKSRIELYEVARNRNSDIYRSWNLVHPTDSFKIVGREDLLEFLRRDFPKESAKQSKSNGPQKTVSSDPLELIAATGSANFKQLLCQHGRLDPNRASQLKLITPASFNLIVESFPEMKSFEECQEVCILCTQHIFEEDRYRSSHLEAIHQFDVAVGESVDNDGVKGMEYWISKKWLKDWRLQKPKMHSIGENDPSPDDAPFRSDVYCEHDGLTLEHQSRVMISEEGYSIIKHIFPGWDPFPGDTDPCILCTEHVESNRSDRLASMKDAETERVILKKLLSSNPITAERRVYPGITCAVIGSDWIRSWRLWINKPRNNDRPGPADNSLYLCQHGRLLFDPNAPSELASPQLCLVQEDDWNMISQLYPNSGPAILLNAEDASSVRCNLSICVDCYKPPIMEEDALELSVHLLSRDDKPPSIETHLRAKEIINSSKNLYTLFSFSSRRPRRVKHGGQSGRFLSLRLAKNSTVLELKEQIEEIEKIPPFYQSIYYKGQEMTESKALLQELGLEPRDVLQWKSLAEPVILEITDDGSDNEPSASHSTKRVEGRAFQGTLLAGP